VAKEVMERRASDNEYLHKDFHGALSTGLTYVQKHYGEEAVRDYLRQFTRSFYRPLIEEVSRDGLKALERHFRRLYEIEGGDVDFASSEDELVVCVQACPAVTHMRQQGYPVAETFSETTRTVNEALVEGTPFEAELVEYDEETGRSVQRFFRRTA
jgi:hypothetical protein